MNKIVKCILFLGLISIVGCTNKLYQAEIDSLNSNDQERKVVIYWTKTILFIGEDKSGPVTLLTECSTRRLTFRERENGIYFFGIPGSDMLADQTPITTQDIQCGGFANKTVLNQVESGALDVEIKCIAEIDEFSHQSGRFSPSYIKALDAPYTFNVLESSNWSFFGESPDVPSQPECRQ